MLNEVIRLCKGNFERVITRYVVMEVRLYGASIKRAEFNNREEASDFIDSCLPSSDMFMYYEIRKVEINECSY